MVSLNDFFIFNDLIKTSTARATYRECTSTVSWSNEKS